LLYVNRMVIILFIKLFINHLGCLEKDWRNLEIRPYAMNGFRYSIVIGESIMKNLGGPKSSRGRSATQ